MCVGGKCLRLHSGKPARSETSVELHYPGIMSVAAAGTVTVPVAVAVSVFVCLDFHVRVTLRLPLELFTTNFAASR